MASRAPWMSPGAPRAAKPSWLRVPAYVEESELTHPEPPPPPPIEVIASIPPPRSLRRPSVPPPSSRRHPAPQIQTTREVELESELVALHNEYQRVVAESENMRARVMEESEPAIVGLALAIAKKVVGRELATDPRLLQAWVREALGLMPNGEVFAAPDLAMDQDLEATTDALLQPGTAEIRDGAAAIEVSADARLASMADALGVEDQ